MKDEKVCKVCKKPFTWRKKWKKDWEQVLYCSVSAVEEIKIKLNEKFPIRFG